MSGQTVNGHVTYLCDKPFPAEKLYIELTGTERLYWEGDDSAHKNAKHPGMICIKTNILRVTKVLSTFSETSFKTVHGKESFPFSMQLPENLPSSFVHIDKDAYLRMEYKLSAKMGVFNLIDQK